MAIWFNNEWQIQHISGYKIKYNCSSQFIYVFKVFDNLVQYMYPDMFAIKTISHSL